MTVNEIILALECCVQPYSICEGCPLYNKERCRDQLKRAIIDKLNCQKAEIDRYKEQCSKCGEKTAKTIINLQDLLAERKDEIEELEAEIDKQYEQAKADILGNMSDGGTSCHWCIEQHKTEAIKEFAGELKRRLIAGGIFPVLVKNEIENLVKENTEGKQDAVQNTTSGED